jgi:hypothetical protein
MGIVGCFAAFELLRRRYQVNVAVAGVGGQVGHGSAPGRPERKPFPFEKKKQKSSCASAYAASESATAVQKSFASFLQKRRPY